MRERGLLKLGFRHPPSAVWVGDFSTGEVGNFQPALTLEGLDGRRQPSGGGTSRVSREAQARICEGLGVKSPGPTRPRGAIPRADLAMGNGAALCVSARAHPRLYTSAVAASRIRRLAVSVIALSQTSV